MVKYFILFFGLSVSLFLIVLLMRNREKKPADVLLILWFFTSFLHLLFYFLGFNYLLVGQHWIIAIGNSLPVLHISINALYIDVLRSKPIRNRIYIYGAIFLMYIFIFYYMSTSGSILQKGILLNYAPTAAWWTYYVPPSFLLIYVLTGSYILRSIQSYRFNLKSLYSSNIHTNTTWLGYWFWSYLLGSVLVILFIIFMDIELISVNAAYILVSFILSLQVFFVGQLGIPNNFKFTEAPDTFFKYRASGLKYEKKGLLKDKLLDYLDATTPYLNPDLSLKDLAEGMGLPPYQISQLINESLQTNFYDLINQYRISTFKERVINPKYSHMSILGIALDCGFNSKSGFYKVFKKQTGMSPSEYKKSVL